MMPYTGTTVNGCDCYGGTPASGVLIDGVTPSINTTQHGTWASQLFVVNRNGRPSFSIGFQFSNLFYLRHVSIAYLDCGLWNIGVSNINVYASHVFPILSTAAAENIGTRSVDDTFQSCTSLRSISIAIQPTEATNSYFIEFSFPSDSQLNWVHLGEISFGDMIPPTSATDSITTTPCRSKHHNSRMNKTTLIHWLLFCTAEHKTTVASPVHVTTLPALTTEEDDVVFTTSDSVTMAENTTTTDQMPAQTTLPTDVTATGYYIHVTSHARSDRRISTYQ